MDKNLLSMAIESAKNRSNLPVESVDGEAVEAPVMNVDADTVKVGNQAYRIQGFNAPEVAGVKGGIFIPPENQYDTTQQDVSAIAKEAGMTELVSKGTDNYNRVLADLVNPETKDSLSSLLVRTGAIKPRLDTPDEDVAAGIATQVFSKAFGTKDPVMKIVADSNARRAELGQDPVYKPKIFVEDPKQYRAFKQGQGVGAAAKETAEIERLEKILARTDLSPEVRARVEGNLQKTRENLYLASTTPDFVGGVLVQPSDRNIMNEANSQFTTSVYRGLLDIGKMLGGAGQMAGDKTGWEALSGVSKQYVDNMKLRQGALGDTLNSFRDISTRNPWETITDTATYTSNLVGGTLPMMALLIGSTLATGGMNPLLGFAASSIPGAVLYSGGFYADQPDDKKNAELATTMGIASGILDRVGLEGMILRNSLFSMAGQKEVLEALTKQGAKFEGDVAAAKEFLETAAKQEILDTTKFAADFAKRQYATKEAFTRGSALLGARSGAEATTESAQTAAELAAVEGEWVDDLHLERGFTDALVDAAVGGSTVGSVFSTAMQGKNAADWQIAADRLRDYERGATEAMMFQQQFKEKYEDPSDPNTIKNAARTIATDPVPETSEKKWFNSWADMPIAEGTWNAVKAIVQSPLRLVRQHANATVPTVVNADGTLKENLGLLKAIMGGYGILPGDHYSAAKQRQMGRWSGNTAEELASEMGVSVREADKAVRQAWLDYWSQGQKIPVTDKRSLALQTWKDTLGSRKDIDDYLEKLSKHNSNPKVHPKPAKPSSLQATMFFDLTEAGVNAEEVMSDEALFESSTVDPKTLAANRSLVEDSLVSAGVKRRLAKETVDGLLSRNPQVVQQARNFAASKGIFQDPRLQDVFENNIFTSIENLKDMLSDRLVGQQYLGKDGEVLQKLINKAYQAGEVTDEQLPFLVKDVKDWYDIITNQFDPLEKYPKLKKVLAWGTTLTMMAFLGKAALSSQVEVATSTLGTPGPLIKKQVAAYASNFLNEIRSDVNKFNSYTISTIAGSYARELPDDRIQNQINDIVKVMLEKEDLSAAELEKMDAQIRELYDRQVGRRLFERLGYNETGYNTQSKFEYADNNMRQAMHVFATVIGLRAQTDALRMAALSVAGDIVAGKITNLAAIPRDQRYLAFTSGEGLNKSQAQDLNDLMSWGMDVDYVLNELPTLVDFLDNRKLRDVSRDVGPFEEHILSVFGNMVDGKVMNPQAFNIPKYYNDPRLRILTAMQRFMATAQAVLLPKLYLQYLRDGNAGMRYQAFSIIVGAMLMAFFVNGLKDQLSYGEDSPYVNGVWKNLQRTAYTSGMLGQGERVVEAFSNLYPERKKDFKNEPLRSTWNVAAELSPVLGWSERPVRAALGLAEGDTEKFVKQSLRAAPVTGSFPIVADVVSSNFKED